ncbi:hypothetical protein [Streptomyces sp. NBC_01571]|uniref:hypothetical protein n=1 Tax=Streptomyces sp. NBC_01571 TaxID=2975883 RepID=UPI002259F620|nr:hypothetical protein [Streptomyces sp. NBC_01571]
MTVEYFMYTAKYGAMPKLDELNAYGAEGWELVTVASGSWVFKRETAPAEPEAMLMRATTTETAPVKATRTRKTAAKKTEA